MKLGKAPATHDPRDLLFEHYRTGTLPRRPRTFGHENVQAPWGVLGNDAYGDCVFAGAAHETMIWTAEAGLPATFTPEAVLGDYGAVTGFTPTDPNSDQGTIVRDALSYRQKTGVRDAAGKRHRIGAYVALEPGNLNHILEALYLFGAVGIGIQFPASAMGQFDRRQPWSVVAGSQIEGGHYVPLVAERRRLEAVTWGRVQEVTAAFMAKFCDEAWAIISPEMLVPHSGRSPEGFDLNALSQDLQALKQ